MEDPNQQKLLSLVILPADFAHNLLQYLLTKPMIEVEHFVNLLRAAEIVTTTARTENNQPPPPEN
jgi:hypothetical protein